MQSEEFKTGFKKIADAATAEALLTQQIRDKIQRGAGVVPMRDLKSLFGYFVMIAVPLLVLYAALNMIDVQLPAGNDFETIIEQNRALSWHTAEMLSDVALTVSFVQGVVWAFFKLLALTFVLTAAVMPVGRREEIKGGLPCADC
ncbi:MAG: hypothetical protein KKB51_19985 [Candidatus Riflebacteria bacterium]|nr:hypothetical protein [Candidatus Riflebacteria bacterium]